MADGSCDVSCNVSECSFDGGDCDLSTEDDIGLYDENQHFANYDDDINSYNENQHRYNQESAKENLFLNMNFGGDIALKEVPAPGKKMHSLLDILIKKDVKKDHFKGNLSYFREVDKIRYTNPNDSGNVNVVDKTMPFTYNHNFTSHILGYEGIQFASEGTANQDIGNTNPQPYEEIYGREGNDTLYLQRISKVQQKREDNTNSGKTFIIPGSSLIFQQKHNQYKDNSLHVRTIMLNNSSGSSIELHSFGNNGADLHNYRIGDAEMHRKFYPRLAKRDLGNMKENVLERNGNNMFGEVGKWQNLRSSKLSKGNVNHNKNQNIHVAPKSNQTYGTEKVISSQTHKHKPVRNVSSYNAKLHKLYQKLNGKSDEPEKFYAKRNTASADKNLINPELQYSDFDVEWRNEDSVSNVAKKKHKTMRMYNAQQYGNSLSAGKKARDTYAESLLYVNRLYNQEFGFEPRKVPAHMPHLIDTDIMESLQARYCNCLACKSLTKSDIGRK